MIGDQKMNGEIVDEEEMKNEDGTTIAAQTLTYNAMVDHNGMELTCTVNHQGYTDDQMNNNENKKSLTLDIKSKCPLSLIIYIIPNTSSITRLI